MRIPPSRWMQRLRSIPVADYGILLLMVSPNLVWILLDRGRWVSDTSLYALDATKLHHTLLHDAANWWREMLAVSPKPPILPWVGQFFVAMGRVIGSIDIGLLLLTFATNYAALWFLYKTLRLAWNQRSVALLGCLIVAAAPMFVFLSRHFYVQPVQLLAVSWFLWIMVASRGWDSLSTLLHLVPASSVAVLATMSSPAYCVVPGLIALWYSFGNRSRGIRFRRSHLGISVVGLVTAALAGLWYLENFDDALAYGRFGYSFAYAAEVKDVFLLKLAEWSRLLLYGFFLSASICSLFPWAAWRRAKGPWSGDVVVMSLLTAQVVLVFMMLVSSAHQTFRYLLPLAPYFAVVGTWSLSTIDKSWLWRAAPLALGLQLVVTNVGLYLGGDRYLTRERQRYLAVLDAIGQATADDPPDSVWLGTGELGVYASDAAYRASKYDEYHVGDPPEFRSIEVSLTESGGDVEAIWERIESSRRTKIILMRNPRFADVTNEDDGWQRVIRGTVEISNRVRNSPKFERIPTPRSSELEIYRDVGGT